MTEAEQHVFHLSTFRCNYKRAVKEYKRYRNNPLGRLIAARELPILRRAEEMLH